MTPTEQRYAQIEKEALAFTWACERLSDYLIGLSFRIQTDHKPLVPLFSSKHLEELPIRVQRFRLRMMRFQFSICHVPGKDLIIADTLSRAPAAGPTQADDLFQQEASAFLDVVLKSIPATEQRIKQIREIQLQDPACQQISLYCQCGWPDKHSLPEAVKPYFPVAAELFEADNLLMRGSRIVIPPSLREETLGQIHSSHQGISKCRERARQSVWWPGISKELERVVQRCTECCKAQSQRAQPLVPTPLPELPWQKVATDLFQWKQKTFLLVIDYYSRYIEVARLNNSTAEEVVAYTKSIFARHGIPETVVSDNGPQYTSEMYAEFAKSYQFEHVTSSPYYPKSNGEAERAVGTIKRMWEKCDDPYLALLAYRSTPLHIGYSPSELLMSRMLRSTVPTTRGQRFPRVLDQDTVRVLDNKTKGRQKKNHDSHHGARALPPLNPGDSIWIPDRQVEARVDQEVGPQSYEVTSSDGSYRRNRRDLVSLPDPSDREEHSVSDRSATESHKPRRSSRTSRPPERLDPSWDPPEQNS